jgi:trimeric autotransporter adhesin
MRNFLPVFLCLLVPASLAAPSGDDVHWSPQFGPPGLAQWAIGTHVAPDGQIMASQLCAPETNCPVQLFEGGAWRMIGMMSGEVLHYALTIQKRGPVWYLGGGFAAIDGVPYNNFATWDGSRWSTLGEGLPQGIVYALAFHKDELYAAGWPSSETEMFIRKWNGAEWLNMGGAFTGSGIVYSLVSDGSHLYAGGYFSLNGANVARWNGSQWEAVGTRLVDGTHETVHSLTFFRNELYALVRTVPTAVATSSIWKWDGAAWTKLNVTFRGGEATAFAAWNDSLYINGNFTNVNSQVSRGLARFDGQTFHPLEGLVASAALQPTPSGIYFTGQFGYTANGPDSDRRWMLTQNMAFYNGSTYENIHSEFSNGIGLFPATFAHAGNLLYAGGTFRGAGDAKGAHYVAVWDGAKWSPLGTGMENRTSTASPRVNAILPFGNEVFVGGTFSHAGGVAATNVAIWDGQSWRAAGDGFNSTVNTLVEYNGRVYAGGVFSRSGAEAIFFIAAWNGATWEDLGACCLAGPTSNGGVTDAVVLDDRLFIAGRLLGGGTTNNVFELVGDEFLRTGSFERTIAAITALNGNLYVGGDFRTVNGQPMRHMARWDGANWSAVGPELDAGVLSLAVHKGKLHVGGSFTNSTGARNLKGIARLDPASNEWQPLGSGFHNIAPAPAVVRTLYSTGTDLFVGGSFVRIGDLEEPNHIESFQIARWNEDVNFYSGGNEEQVTLTSLTVSGGVITVRGNGPAGREVMLEVSADLLSWTEAGVFTGTIDHTGPTAGTRQFYRARLR